jgi:hypothetical protein
MSVATLLMCISTYTRPSHIDILVSKHKRLVADSTDVAYGWRQAGEWNGSQLTVPPILLMTRIVFDCEP